MLPDPIPASTTASITEKAIGNEATYKRKNRNQTTSRHRRMAPVPKLMKSKRHGGRYLISKRSGSARSVRFSSGVAPSILATSKAIAAAMQLAKPAANAVPRSPNASTRQASPSRAPATAPKVLKP